MMMRFIIILLLIRQTHQQLERHDDITYGSLGGYLTSTEIREYLETYEETHERVTSVSNVFSYGRSLKNVSLLGICLGACNGTRPQALFTSLIHSREPMALMALISFMDRLESRFKEDSVEALLKSRTIWILPILNPDGYDMNQRTHPNGGGLQRKNVRENCEHGSTTFDQIGIDLNRNFPVCFDLDEDGSSSRACAEDYRGSEAFSEPETAALRDWMSRSEVSVSIALNFHSFGRVLNLPNMCRHEGKTQDEAFFLEFAQDVLRDQSEWDAGHPYDDGLYSVNGALSDWMYKEHHVLAMAPEMGPSFTTRLSDEKAFWPDRNMVLPMALEVQTMIHEASWRAGALYQVVITIDDDKGKLLRVSNIGLRESSGDVHVLVTSSSISKDDALSKLQQTGACSILGDMDSRSEKILSLNNKNTSNMMNDNFVAIAVRDELICVTYVISNSVVEEHVRDLAETCHVVIEGCDPNDVVSTNESNNSLWGIPIFFFIFLVVCILAFVAHRIKASRRRGTVSYKAVKEDEEITIELEGV